MGNCCNNDSYSPVPSNYFCFICKRVGHHWLMECKDNHRWHVKKELVKFISNSAELDQAINNQSNQIKYIRHQHICDESNPADNKTNVLNNHSSVEPFIIDSGGFTDMFDELDDELCGVNPILNSDNHHRNNQNADNIPRPRPEPKPNNEFEAFYPTLQAQNKSDSQLCAYSCTVNSEHKTKHHHNKPQQKNTITDIDKYDNDHNQHHINIAQPNICFAAFYDSLQADNKESKLRRNILRIETNAANKRRKINQNNISEKNKQKTKQKNQKEKEEIYAYIAMDDEVADAEFYESDTSKDGSHFFSDFTCNGEEYSSDVSHSYSQRKDIDTETLAFATSAFKLIYPDGSRFDEF